MAAKKSDPAADVNCVVVQRAKQGSKVCPNFAHYGAGHRFQAKTNSCRISGFLAHVLALLLLTPRTREVFMTTLERCLEFLDRNHVCYAHTKHSLAFTALEVAFAEHISPHKLAKTVVYASAQGYGLAVLPADCLVDLSMLGNFVNDPFVRLASERELAELFPECELGAMPPVGILFHLPAIVDSSVASQEFIAFNAGTHRDVIHMYYADFSRLTNPAVASFALTAVEEPIV